MCFFVLHSFTGIIEVEVIFFFFFFLEKENSRAQSWVDQRQPGWRKIPPVERKRKEEGKSERKKDIHNKKALELIERRGYKSEHKSLAPKKTR